MIFQHFEIDANESNAYIVGCEKTKKAALIDCGKFDQRVVDFVNQHQLNLVYIILTHGHWDHTEGLDEFMAAFPNAKVAGLVDNLPEGRGEELQPGAIVKIGELEASILKTSGHTGDSISIYIESEKMVFSGDALFAGSIGGTTTDSKKKELQDNIEQFLMSLPEVTEVFPGHGPATTIGVEKKYNPLLNP